MDVEGVLTSNLRLPSTLQFALFNNTYVHYCGWMKANLLCKVDHIITNMPIN